jgi:hypothetical protein
MSRRSRKESKLPNGIPSSTKYNGEQAMEYFLPGKFEPCPWSDSYSGDKWATRDREPQPLLPARPSLVPIKALCHATHECLAGLIMAKLAEFAHFSGSSKSGYSDAWEVLANLPLFWLAPMVDAEACRATLKKKLKEAVPDPSKAPDHYDPDRISHSFARSPAFSDNSRYGPKGFSMSVQRLLESMAAHWGLEEDDIEFRALGTFEYPQEWMHTVLICPKINNGSGALARVLCDLLNTASLCQLLIWSV